jgi:hypothetical protein
MTGKRFVTAATLLLLAGSTGCCRWWCEHCGYGGQPVAGYAAPVAPVCGCYPQPAYYPPPQPAAVPAQPANWAQPQQRQLTGCSCTCPPQ